MSDPQPQSVARLLRDGVSRLGGSEARFEIELLLMHALGCDRAWLFSHPESVPDATAAGLFAELVERRARGEPVAYLTGKRSFWTLDLDVSPDVLIPRPDTELLVEAALEKLRDLVSPEVLDLGTGSGAIALALAAERGDARIVAVDSSEEALAVAARNAGRLGLDSVRFVHGNWYAPVAGRRFHLLASNPPYIEVGDPHLQLGDLRHEPHQALASGADGLEDLRLIVAAARQHLHPAGWLVVEHGSAQGAAVRDLLSAAWLDKVETRRDIEDRERITLGQA